MLPGGAELFSLLPRRQEILNLCKQHLLPSAQAAMVALYEGNEANHPQSEQLIANLGKGINQVLLAVLPIETSNFIHEFVQENLLPQVHNVIRSMLQDRNHCGTPQETIVNDHTATFPL